MYNNVIVVPLLPKIADCAQQDHVLDLTRLFPSLAVGKGSGPRDYVIIAWGGVYREKLDIDSAKLILHF